MTRGRIESIPRLCPPCRLIDNGLFSTLFSLRVWCGRPQPPLSLKELDYRLLKCRLLTSSPP